MIINPWGQAIWERIQRQLDHEIKARGHENIYCPLLIPLSHIERESEHIDGFAKECAVVTHTKLKKNAEGKLEPTSELEEPLVIRPTSEMIIGDVFAQRIQSYRDLPVLFNQWANIMRWEMRTRMFLRTSEFLWQEGHTAHESEQEAHTHATKMLDCYKNFCRDYLAIPIVTGKKSKNEKFPGAVETYTIEGIMQDNKALQMGTSHYLGQTFAKSCHIQYQDAEKKLQYVHTTSWGVTTRLIGGLIMTHADDDGLMCPPGIAPYHVVIIPIIRNDNDQERLLKYCQSAQQAIQAQSYMGESIRVHIDTKNKKPSEKKWSWVKKGVPIRCEVGLNELDSQSLCYALRTQQASMKKTLSITAFCTQIEKELEHIQHSMMTSAKKRLFNNACPLISTYEQLEAHFSKEKPSPALIYWIDDDELEQALQTSFKVSIRCYPDDNLFSYPSTGKSINDTKQNGRLALIAKAY